MASEASPLKILGLIIMLSQLVTRFLKECLTKAKIMFKRSDSIAPKTDLKLKTGASKQDSNQLKIIQRKGTRTIR